MEAPAFRARSIQSLSLWLGDSHISGTESMNLDVLSMVLSGFRLRHKRICDSCSHTTV